ncbi:MAG: hypothetical protein WKG06_30875 [Segetibacter sp.]
MLRIRISDYRIIYPIDDTIFIEDIRRVVHGLNIYR